MNTDFRRDLRQASGRNPEPSAGAIDSQSVKTTEECTERGYDAGKCIKGRKRHILVDTLGLLLFALVLTADVQDRDGAKMLFEKVKACFPRLKLVWADGGYAGKLVDWVKQFYRWVLEIVNLKRCLCHPRLVVLILLLRMGKKVLSSTNTWSSRRKQGKTRIKCRKILRAMKTKSEQIYPVGYLQPSQDKFKDMPGSELTPK